MDVLDELREEGRAEGERIGERRGERKGQAKALLKQLTARFGPVPAEAKARILAATEAEHERWLLRVLTARSLQGVLAAPRPRAKKPGPTRGAARA